MKIFARKSAGKTKHWQEGFTIFELIVAVFLFSLVAGVAFNLLFAGLSAQRSSLARQSIVNQTSFVAEYMSRALREAQKDAAGTCITAGWNYELASADEIEFIDKDGICRTISLESGPGGYGVIREEKGPTLDLTSDDLDVQALTFSLLGADQSDSLQPRVTFSIHVKARGVDPEVFFQSTVSQRHFDVQE